MIMQNHGLNITECSMTFLNESSSCQPQMIKLRHLGRSLANAERASLVIIVITIILLLRFIRSSEFDIGPRPEHHRYLVMALSSLSATFLFGPGSLRERSMQWLM